MPLESYYTMYVSRWYVLSCCRWWSIFWDATSVLSFSSEGLLWSFSGSLFGATFRVHFERGWRFWIIGFTSINFFHWDWAMLICAWSAWCADRCPWSLSYRVISYFSSCCISMAVPCYEGMVLLGWEGGGGRALRWIIWHNIKIIWNGNLQDQNHVFTKG